jgi:hypothetical protein
VELYYLYARGVGVSYLRSITRNSYLDFYFGYEFTPRITSPTMIYISPDYNEFIAGIGFQHRVVPFGIWDLSLLYSLRENISWTRFYDTGPFPRPDNEYIYYTGIGIHPKLRIHFLHRLFAYISVAPIFEIRIRKEKSTQYPETWNIDNTNKIEAIVGIGCNF